MDKIQPSRRAPFGSNPQVGQAGRATQQRILTAANDAFGELGYAHTSVETITERAGCSRPTFYQYFSGKEDLHRRLAARFGDELGKLIQGLDPVTPDAAGRAVLHDWFLRQTAVYDAYRAVANSFTAAVRTDERVVTGAADLSTQYRQALVAALDRDSVDTADLDTLAAAVNTVAFGASQYREHFGRVAAARQAEALADLVHRTLFGARPGVNLAPFRPSRRTRRPALPDPTDDTTRRPRGVRTRARLLEAAGATFTVLGYEATRVDDIAAEAGMSHGTFYRYFEDKEAAFAPHLVAAATELVELVDRLPPDEPVAWAEAQFECYARHGGIVATWLEATAGGVAIAHTTRAALAAALATALDRRDFGDTDADVLAAFALLEGLPAAAFAGRGLTVEGATTAAGTILGRGFFGI